jgi:hypothetical protein
MASAIAAAGRSGPRFFVRSLLPTLDSLAVFSSQASFFLGSKGSIFDFLPEEVPFLIVWF